MTSRLSLTVLVENSAPANRDLIGEDGLSFFIETEGTKILFDTGLSGLFLANAEKLATGLRDLDYVVLSHGHIDHTGGLPALSRHLAGTGPDTPPAKNLNWQPTPGASGQKKKMAG